MGLQDLQAEKQVIKFETVFNPLNGHHLNITSEQTRSLQKRSELRSFTVTLEMSLMQLNHEFSSYLGLFVATENIKNKG